MQNTFMMDSRIETSEFILREPTPADASLIFHSYAQDHDVTKYMTWQPHKDISETLNFLQKCIILWHENKEFNMVVMQKKTQQIVGMIRIAPQGNTASIGYVLAKRYWNKGYATHLLHELIAYLFQKTDLTFIQSFCDIDNIASARVMEKAGMKKKGILPEYILHPNRSPKPVDVFLYEAKRKDFAYEVKRITHHP
jgi:RimJ/RimL family protein N-acetyltransferase